MPHICRLIFDSDMPVEVQKGLSPRWQHLSPASHVAVAAGWEEDSKMVVVSRAGRKEGKEEGSRNLRKKMRKKPRHGLYSKETKMLLLIVLCLFIQ